jgi:hypothetical protein
MRNKGRGLLPVDELLDVGREVALLSKLAGELARFRFGGNLASKKQPEDTFGNNFFATWRRRKLPLTVGDAQAMEAYALSITFEHVNQICRTNAPRSGLGRRPPIT